MQSLLGARSGAARVAAVVAVVAAVGAAGCSSGGSSSSASSSGSSGTKVNAVAELTASVSKMADAQQVKSYAADLTVQVSGIPGSGSSSSSGSFSMSGAVKSERQPTPLTEFDASSIQAEGQTLGSMSDVITPTALYMKMPMLTTVLHKPWVELPFSELKGGSGLSQMLNQVQNADPLSATALLGGVTNARTIGTSTVNGVPVTEVSGTEPATAALSKLPASMRSSLGQEIDQLGIGQITFQVWIDGQHDIRKAVIKEAGSTFSETMSFTVTGINQQVSISQPPASQVATIPASELNMAGL